MAIGRVIEQKFLAALRDFGREPCKDTAHQVGLLFGRLPRAVQKKVWWQAHALNIWLFQTTDKEALETDLKEWAGLWQVPYAVIDV
jgi:hypothetical protein